MIQQPPYLKEGSVIGITCPSGYVAEARVAHAITVLQQWGFKVKVGKTVGTEYHYFSGDDQHRLTDLQVMLDDNELDAILMGRGGYGMSRIIDGLDFTKFLEKPKWVCGFSDITVLLNHLQARHDIPSLHSPMCGAFKPETDNADHLKNFRAALTGEALTYIAPPSANNRYGTAEGILTGANLAILAHLTGSVSEVDTKGKILFIEDIGEYYYNIDRMLLNLKRAGKLDGIIALIAGGFTDMQDTERPFGQNVENIIMDKVREYGYPVCFNFPSGHQEINYTLRMGMPHRLTVDETGARLVSVQ